MGFSFEKMFGKKDPEISPEETAHQKDVSDLKDYQQKLREVEFGMKMARGESARGFSGGDVGQMDRYKSEIARLSEKTAAYERDHGKPAEQREAA